MRSKDLIEASNSIRGSANQQRSRDVPTQELMYSTFNYLNIQKI